MSLEENQNENSLEDVIFEGRNKSYGAYELRQNKSKRILLALLVGSLFFTATILTVFLTSKGKVKKVVKITKVELKKRDEPKEMKKPEVKIEKKKEVQKKVESVVKAVQNVPPRVIKEKVTVKEVPPVESFKEVNTNSEKTEGNANANFDKGGNTSDDPVKGVEEVEDPNQIYNSVEINPEPPGGINAFRKKIGDTFRLPEVEETLVGTVVGRFVVDENGSISDIKILKETPANLKLADEYKRVLMKMPKWKPGVMNGRSVKVYYTLPIQIQITASE
jgi:periplasmic protein TonB